MKEAGKNQVIEFEVTCPYCGETITDINNDPEDEKIKCPACGETFLATFCYYTSY